MPPPHKMSTNRFIRATHSFFLYNNHTRIRNLIKMASIVHTIKEYYGSIATELSTEREVSTRVNGDNLDPITQDLYSAQDQAAVPLKAIQASLGCGNPTAMVNIKPGQTVLDLGSGRSETLIS